MSGSGPNSNSQVRRTRHTTGRVALRKSTLAVRALLLTPDTKSLAGKRDRLVLALAMLVGRKRRNGLTRLSWEDVAIDGRGVTVEVGRTVFYLPPLVGFWLLEFRSQSFSSGSNSNSRVLSPPMLAEPLDADSLTRLIRSSLCSVRYTRGLPDRTEWSSFTATMDARYAIMTATVRCLQPQDVDDVVHNAILDEFEHPLEWKFPENASGVVLRRAVFKKIRELRRDRKRSVQVSALEAQSDGRSESLLFFENVPTAVPDATERASELEAARKVKSFLCRQWRQMSEDNRRYLARLAKLYEREQSVRRVAPYLECTESAIRQRLTKFKRILLRVVRNPQLRKHLQDTSRFLTMMIEVARSTREYRDLRIDRAS